MIAFGAIAPLLVLQGAVDGRLELLAHAAPTYYGMAVAVVRSP